MFVSTGYARHCLTRAKLWRAHSFAAEDVLLTAHELVLLVWLHHGFLRRQVAAAGDWCWLRPYRCVFIFLPLHSGYIWPGTGTVDSTWSHLLQTGLVTCLYMLSGLERCPCTKNVYPHIRADWITQEPVIMSDIVFVLRSVFSLSAGCSGPMLH